MGFISEMIEEQERRKRAQIENRRKQPQGHSPTTPTTQRADYGSQRKGPRLVWTNPELLPSRRTGRERQREPEV
jgi:hypothetical protein